MQTSMEDNIPVSLALYYTESSQVYGAAIDIENVKITEKDKDRLVLMTEYEDNTQFNNLETLIIQNNVNCLITYGSPNSGKLQHIAPILEQLNVELKCIKKSLFSSTDVEHDLAVIIGEDSLNLYPDVISQSLSLKAANVLIQELKLSSGSYVGKYSVRSYSINNYMRLDNSALTTLNIFPADRIKDRVSSIFGLLNATVTAGMGERLLRRWLRQPLVSADEINQRLDLVELFVEESEIRDELRTNGLKGLIDIDKYARKLELRTKFNLRDLYTMYQAVNKIDTILIILQRSSHHQMSTLSSVLITPLQDVRASFQPFLDLTDRVIDRKSLSMSPPEFNIDPCFNEGLKEIAERRDDAYDEIMAIYKQYRDKYPSIDLKCENNARFGYCFRAVSRYNNEVNAIPDVCVLQVLKNGIYFTIDGKKNLRDPSALYSQFKSEYNAAQQELVASIVDVAVTYIPLFHILSNIISQIDLLASFAHITANATIPYTRPELLDITNNNYIEVEEARHPLLEIQSSIQFIPNNYKMKGRIGEADADTENVVIITGPNMGGKSTYMRQLGILIILAQIGCFVPAKHAVFPPFTALFTRIGASDNQSRGVSTFMSEMIDMSNILCASQRNDTKTNSLIIIDELGRGTSTYDGLGLSWGILEYIINKIPNCYCLFTTHYYELTTIAKSFSNVKNLHVTALSKENYIAMMYGVKDGPSDKSFGINVAQLCNFPKEIISDAKKKVLELEAIAKSNFEEENNNSLSNSQQQKRASDNEIDRLDKKIRLLIEQPQIYPETVNQLIADIERW